MTQEQYSRWKDFAIRMARSCFCGARRPNAEWIAEQVQDVFDQLDPEDIPFIRDWDHSDAYPEGHPRYAEHRYGSYGGPARAPLLCDWMTEWEDFIWDSPREYMTAREYDRWGRLRRTCKDDDADDLMQDVVDRWSGPVHCCVRAGLGCAVDGGSGMGVLGFTAGDLRRMFPEGVPDWVKGEPTWETIGVKAVMPGVGFVPEPRGDAVAFEAIPDSQGVWL